MAVHTLWLQCGATHLLTHSLSAATKDQVFHIPLLHIISTIVAIIHQLYNEAEVQYACIPDAYISLFTLG